MQGVIQEDRCLEPDRGLGDDEPGARDVPGLEIVEADLVGQRPPVSEAHLLEVLQVDGIVDVSEGIQVLVTDLDPHEHGRVLQRLLSLGTVAPRIVHTPWARHPIYYLV